mgnify:CR=1 FL=1
MRRAALEACIAAAHAAGRPRVLARAYALAAEIAAGEDEAAFLLTQAYVNALEAGSAEAPALFARLAAMGRDSGPGPGDQPAPPTSRSCSAIA